ncbi:MAG: sigma-70 family RNA polymerase sigma factor [Planctomycetes bacterium]|nr:sigma-70 family RNA polymerase sigma factor [Planctomycetota bacterium]
MLRNGHDAEDLASDTLVAAWVEFPKLDDPQQVTAWSIRALRNRVVSFFRRRRLEPTWSTELVAAWAVPSDPGDGLSAKEMLASLRTTLSAPDAAVLDCLLVGLNDCGDIAGARGVGLRAVERSRARIRAASLPLWKFA